MPKREEVLRQMRPLNGPTAISDYPDLISDTTVVFAHQHIVPSVVDEVGDEAQFEVHYGSVHAVNGTLLTLDQIAVEPGIVVTKCDRSAVYTLLMVDPDAPSPAKPDFKDVLYWMVNNIKGAAFEDGDFTVEYMPPEPARGEHRYVFLLFKQPGFMQVEPPSKRVNFQTKMWAKEHGLGNPVAGVFVNCRHGK